MSMFTFIVCWRTCDPRSVPVMSKHECIFNDCIKCGHRVAATVRAIEETRNEGAIPIGICCDCATSDDMREFFRDMPIQKGDNMSAADMASFVAVMKTGRGEPGIN